MWIRSKQRKSILQVVLVAVLTFAFLTFAVVPILKAEDQAQPTFVSTWGKKGEGAGEFQSPIGIALNSKDEILVTDLNNARVQKFSTDGRYLGEFPVPRDNAGKKSAMIGGIAIGHDDQIYLTYMVRHQVEVFRDSGESLRVWGSKGEGDGEFNQPGGLIFLNQHTLLIADQCNHRIQSFTTEGKYLGQWGGYGPEFGQFDGVGPKGSRFGGPHFLACDRQGRIYTTEGIQGRIQQFTAAGTPLAAWGRNDDQPGGFGNYQLGAVPNGVGPIGIVTDEIGRIFVSSLNDRIQCFEPTGKYLFSIKGTDAPDDKLLHPHGMAFDQNGFLFICDSGNHRILKFKIPSSLPLTK